MPFKSKIKALYLFSIFVKNINGYIEITGNGEQSRDFTHVSDIVNGHIMAMNSDIIGIIDLCTGINHTLNK